MKDKLECEYIKYVISYHIISICVCVGGGGGGGGGVGDVSKYTSFTGRI